MCLVKRREQANSLISHPFEHPPAKIPTCPSPRHPRLRLIQTLRAEGITPRQAPEFVEKVVGIDVVDPGVSHGFCRVRCIESGEDALDAAELREGVDGVGVEGAEEAIFVCLDERGIVSG